MLDPKWARTSLHKPESASVTAANSKTSRLQSSEPTGKDEGKKLRSARKRRIPSRSRSGEEFEWVLLVSTLSTLSENQATSRIRIIRGPPPASPSGILLVARRMIRRTFWVSFL
ncbi:hypothetical protein COP1_045960 [Malus domestica]